MRSNSLVLDDAFGTLDPITLMFRPTAAQFGALRCHEAIGRRTNRDYWDDPTDPAISGLTQLWQSGQSLFWKELAEVVQSWASRADPSAGATIGYWLTWIREHGMSDVQVEELTRFLAEPSFAPKRNPNRSVRRYPTGGVSEKQAILLPAVLRFLSDSENFHSSFMIARRLGHTGGTSDKLRILPGFRVQPASELSEWTGNPPAVRYFTADANFCPRDEVLYFLRGETGTVRHLALIVASIMSKQFALQTDCTLIDILHGDGAFFRTVDEAENFQKLAGKISMSLDLPIEFVMRPTWSVSWQSIGNATEVAEVLDLLKSPSPSGIPPRSELSKATEFAARLVVGPGTTAADVHAKVERAWQEGQLLTNLIALWSEHHVEPSFLSSVESLGSDAILGRLCSVEISAPIGGVLRSKNVVELADLVNTQLNSYQKTSGGLPQTIGIGGVTLGVPLGERVEAGQPLVRVYSTEAIDERVLESLSTNLKIEEDFN